MRRSAAFVAALLPLTAVLADPTWPADTDEMEEIMYQLYGTNTRLFADVISPCSKEASGPGRQNAAEWFRVAFHDMATANYYFKTGGLDGSIQYELDDGENDGPGQRTTLEFMANYYSSRSGVASLIAAGAYASMRSCGGPILSVRGGYVDATEAGDSGVPQAGNSLPVLIQQFDRMSFNATEMIELIACGHSMGGVHNRELPQLVPNGTGVNGEASFRSTVATYDNLVVTEYLAGNTSNPLVVGPSVEMKWNSDGVIFGSDKNVTMQKLADPEYYMSRCQTMIQKMIEVVPGGVNLTDPILPYMVKPVDMQLTLNTDGSLSLTGYIRVKTTDLSPSSISSITMTYKDRNGGDSCGTCRVNATVQGACTGLDDSFVVCEDLMDRASEADIS